MYFFFFFFFFFILSGESFRRYKRQWFADENIMSEIRHLQVNQYITHQSYYPLMSNES